MRIHTRKYTSLVPTPRAYLCHRSALRQRLLAFEHAPRHHGQQYRVVLLLPADRLPADGAAALARLAGHGALAGDEGAEETFVAEEMAWGKC